MRPRYLVAAIGYGLCIYLLAGEKAVGFVIALVSLAFLFGVPFGIGYLTTKGVPSESSIVAALAPWVPVTAILGVLFLLDREGTICIVMALPLLLLGATSGGLFAHARRNRDGAGGSKAELGTVLLLPLLLSPVERLVDPADRFSESVTSIMIAAPAARVWDEIAEVDTIGAAERGRALYTAIGFPPPIAATLDVAQEGGVRRASFGGGVLFIETITEWEPLERLSFEIDPSFDEGEPALDPHVRIGGAYFDVLSGRYAIEPVSADSVRLVLTSRHRVSTRFNSYASWWSAQVMQSVQRNILAVIKARSEDAARRPKPRIRAATAARALRESAVERVSNSFETGFSVVADLPGRTDLYPDSVVVLVRRGRIAWPRLDAGAVHDSTTAALATEWGASWNTGRPSRGLVVEHGPGVDTLALGPMLRFTIPRDATDRLDASWVVFTHHLTVPRSTDNPYGTAWTYTHAERARR